MLKEFYQQLRHIASNTDHNFHEHVAKRVGSGATESFENILKEAILKIPELTSAIISLWGRLSSDSKFKPLGKYFVTYMCNPKDFIPEDKAHGLFGYLDDAYFVFSVYELLMEELVRMGQSLTPEDQKLKDQALTYKAKIKSVIPEEASEIQQIIGEALDGSDETFKKLFKAES